MATKSKKQQSKFISRIIAVVLALALVLGAVIAFGYGSKNAAGQWFKNGDITTWFDYWGKGANLPTDDEGNKPEESSFLVRAQYNAGDLATFAATPYADDGNSVYLTILTDPIETDDTFTWSSSDSTCVIVAPANDGRSATVTCLQAFGEQITVKAVSNETGLEAVATCDYVKRLQSATLELSPGALMFGNSPTTHTAIVTPVWSLGTITPELTINRTRLQGLRISESEDDGDGNYIYDVDVMMDTVFTGATFEISDAVSVARGWESVPTGYRVRVQQNLNKQLKAETGKAKVVVEYTVTYNGKTYVDSSVIKEVALDVTNLKTYSTVNNFDQPGVIF